MRKIPLTKVISLATAVSFVAIFSIVGVHLLSKSHAATSQTATSCTVSSTLVNSCRPWFGAAVSGIPGGGSTQQSQFQYLEHQIGHTLDTYRQYSACSSDGNGGIFCKFGVPFAPGGTEQYFATHGYIVDANWKPYSNYAGADGRNMAVNQEIAQVAQNIKALAPTKVMLTIWWEPQIHTSSYSPSCPGTKTNADGGSAAEYNAMWKNVQSIFAQHGVNNVVWAVDYLSTGQSDFDCQVPQLWPVKVGAKVDWVLFDVYGTNNHPTWAGAVGRIYGYLQGLNSSSFNIGQLPWGIGETGNCGDVPDASANPPVTLQDSIDTARQFFVDAKTSYDQHAYPNLKLYQIWDDDISGNGGSECLTGYDVNNQPDPQKQQDFDAFASDVLTSGSAHNPTPVISFSTPSGGSTVSGSVNVAASASVSSGSITTVVLKANGSTLKTCSSASCADTWNTTALANGTYTLEADTTASDGNTNATTETVTVSNSHPVTISAPTNIISLGQTTNSIDLSWNASSDSKYPASQLVYKVLRNGSVVGTTAAGRTNYTDTGLAAGTFYSYTVVARDSSGNTSSPSAAFTQKTRTPNCAKPGAPQGLTGHASNSTSITLSWQTVSNPSSSCVITHYVVSRNAIPLAQPTATNFTDNSATPNTTYAYTVLAVETGNIAGASSSVSVTTPKATQPDPGPSQPSNVVATAVSDTQVNLTWNASNDPVTGIKQYNIIRNGQTVGTSTTTSFGDSGLSAKTQYTYQVVAVSGGGRDATSESVNVTTLPSQNQGDGSSGSGNGGSGGNGSSGSSSSPSLPPILEDTTSVGSGSDTGQVTSQNPTDPGSSTISQLDANNPDAKTRSLDAQKVAYVGGGIAVILVLVVGYWFLVLRRRAGFRPTSSLYDPDFIANIVVGDDKHNPTGGNGSA